MKTNSQLPEPVAKIHGELLYIEIDNTICISNIRDSQGELDYNFSTPIKENIELVNALFEHNTVILYTARGNRTKKIDWSSFTIKQMAGWGVRYHDISFDKPHYDFMICDKTFNNFTDFLVNAANPEYKNRFNAVRKTD